MSETMERLLVFVVIMITGTGVGVVAWVLDTWRERAERRHNREIAALKRIKKLYDELGL